MVHTFDRELTLAGRKVGDAGRVFVIAEAGVAHFGSLEKARGLVDLAVRAGADVVKFQVFRADDLVASAAPDWQSRLRRRELPPEAFREIRDYCVSAGIPFCATAHDEGSLDVLDELGVPFYKIGSGEVSNWKFVENVARRGKPVVLSTGMYTLDDVARAVDTVAAAGNPALALLHCVTRYPTNPSEANLLAMNTLRDRVGVVVGYSDHTTGFHVPLAAVALGARIVEKHITLDYDVPDAQDWKVSCGPADFPDFVRQMREIEAALGTGIKAPVASEAESLAWARKSLVAAVDIEEGARITDAMLRAKRPGTGISPADSDKVVGRTARERIAQDTLVRWDQIR
jgi:N-acetylneuraminate synthase/N,N'-diacetyllegionaminate synthase